MYLFLTGYILGLITGVVTFIIILIQFHNKQNN